MVDARAATRCVRNRAHHREEHQTLTAEELEPKDGAGERGVRGACEHCDGTEHGEHRDVAAGEVADARTQE